MGKISSYPSDANVTTSDRLIGSDNENANETKNFEVGDIINLAASIIIPPGGFVPYTGATANVDLGAFGLTTSYLTSSLGMFIDGAISLNGNEGNTSDVLVSQGPGVTPTWSNALSQFVPYTGATGNVDLGNYDLIADNVQADIFQLNSGGILGLYGTVQLNGSPGTAGQVLTSSGGGVPTWTSLSGFVPYTGATTNVDLGTHSLTADTVSVINELNVLSSAIFILDGSFESGGSTGTSGQILKSLGAGVAPNWVNISTLLTGYVPYTGATTAVNLGIYSMTAANVNANNFVPILGGSGNTFFGGAGGYGVARNGVYALGTDITILGDSTPGSSTHIQIDALNTNIAFLNGYVSLSGTSGLFLLNGFGTAGQVLISSGGAFAPLWSSVAELATNTFWKGSFYDTITQTVAAANTATPVILRNTDTPATNGVSIVTDGTNLSRITFANAGTYNILFSAQLANAGGIAQTVDFWLRQNGSTAAANISNTNGKVQLQGSANYLMAAWNYFVTVAAGDYIQLVWAATSTNISMVSEAANALHPATPSIILTANIV